MERRKAAAACAAVWKGPQFDSAVFPGDPATELEMDVLICSSSAMKSWRLPSAFGAFVLAVLVIVVLVLGEDRREV